MKELAAEVDVVLVIGSTNSSNSNRLVETAQASGAEAHLIEDESMIDERWFEGAKTVGLTAGASTPEHLVRRVCDWFRARGVEIVGESAPVGGGRVLPAAGAGAPDRFRRLR